MRWDGECQRAYRWSMLMMVGQHKGRKLFDFDDAHDMIQSTLWCLLVLPIKLITWILWIVNLSHSKYPINRHTRTHVRTYARTHPKSPLNHADISVCMQHSGYGRKPPADDNCQSAWWKTLLWNFFRFFFCFLWRKWDPFRRGTSVWNVIAACGRMTPRVTISGRFFVSSNRLPTTVGGCCTFLHPLPKQAHFSLLACPISPLGSGRGPGTPDAASYYLLHMDYGNAEQTFLCLR